MRQEANIKEKSSIELSEILESYFVFVGPVSTRKLSRVNGLSQCRESFAHAHLRLWVRDARYLDATHNKPKHFFLISNWEINLRNY